MDPRFTPPAAAASSRRAPRTIAGALGLLVATCALHLALCPTPAAARQAALKIAVVDLDLVFLQSSIGRGLQTELRNLEDATRGRLESEVKSIEELQQRALAASPEERRELQRQREDRELAARRIRDDAARQAQKLEEDSRQRYTEMLEPLFRALQEEHDWDLILNKAGGFVIFAGDSIDVTPLVLERLAAGG